MRKVRLDISMSLDGYVAGPNPTLELPLGKGGFGLHEWIFGLESFRSRHGGEGGERGPDDAVVAEGLRTQGAVIMGRRMFSGGSGAWESDPNAGGWWGEEPPFEVPVFILTHHAREPVVTGPSTSFNFVTGGIEEALAQARAVAGGKDVLIAGGGEVAQQYLRAGLLDEIQIHLVPVFLGSGVRLFDGIPPDAVALEAERVVAASPGVTHLRFRATA
jgi:dihydrofolate reductase